MADQDTINTQENITQELYKRNVELAIKNKTLSILSNLYEVSILALDPVPLAEKVTETIRDGLEFDLVGIFLNDHNSDGMRPLSVVESQKLEEVTRKLNVRFNNLSFLNISKNKFLSKCLDSKKLCHTDNVSLIWDNLISKENLNELQESAHLRTLLLYPLVVESRKVVGLLMIGLNREYKNLPDYEQNSIASFVNVITTALEKALLYKELQVANYRLGDANEKLKELDRQKTEFVSMASHQLRTPLTAIKGYSSMLLEGSFGKLDKKTSEAVSRIFDSSQRLVLVIEDFLNISRIELGKMKYDMTDLDLKDLAEKMTKEMTPTANKKGLEISFEAKGKDFVTNGDIGKVSQIITNLIDNSIKYTPKGSIKVSVERVGDKIHFIVSDTGVGLEAEQIPKLFQKFVRADDAGKVNYTGTGLGLYVVRQMVEAHKGRVWAESDGVGKGSRFIAEFQAKN